MNDIEYSRVGDYLLPNFTLPDEPELSIGKYGLLRKTYLKTHRKIHYINLLTAGTLYKHLVEIDAQARERLEILVKLIAERQGVTENLKAADQMAWVGAMNNIKACAEEIILNELIYE